MVKLEFLRFVYSRLSDHACINCIIVDYPSGYILMCARYVNVIFFAFLQVSFLSTNVLKNRFYFRCKIKTT